LVEHVPPQPENSAGFTAMVVDDHPLVRESMVSRLTAMGAREIVEAASCAAPAAHVISASSTSVCPTVQVLTCSPNSAARAGPASWCCRLPTILTLCAPRSSLVRRAIC